MQKGRGKGRKLSILQELGKQKKEVGHVLMGGCFLEFTESLWVFFNAYHLSLKTLLNYQTTMSEVKELMWDSSQAFSGRNLTIIILKLIKRVILGIGKEVQEWNTLKEQYNDVNYFNKFEIQQRIIKLYRWLLYCMEFSCFLCMKLNSVSYWWILLPIFTHCSWVWFLYIYAICVLMHPPIFNKIHA